MDDRGSWKVGLITVLAILGILAMAAFLLPNVHAVLTGGRWTFYIIFDDAGGLQPAENVLLSGVEIGAVDRVELVASPNSKLDAAVQGYLKQHNMPPHPPPYALVTVKIQAESKGDLLR